MDFYHSPVAVWVNSAPQPKRWGPRAHRGRDLTRSYDKSYRILNRGPESWSAYVERDIKSTKDKPRAVMPHSKWIKKLLKPEILEIFLNGIQASKSDHFHEIKRPFFKRNWIWLRGSVQKNAFKVKSIAATWKMYVAIYQPVSPSHHHTNID